MIYSDTVDRHTLLRSAITVSKAAEHGCSSEQRRVSANWTSATSLTSSPGLQDECSSCFQRQSLNSRANLYSGGMGSKMEHKLWVSWGVGRGSRREGYSVCTSLLEKLMQTICHHTGLLFNNWQKSKQREMLVSAVPDSNDDNQTPLFLLPAAWADSHINLLENNEKKGEGKKTKGKTGWKCLSFLNK